MHWAYFRDVHWDKDPVIPNTNTMKTTVINMGMHWAH